MPTQRMKEKIKEGRKRKERNINKEESNMWRNGMKTMKKECLNKEKINY